MRYIQTYLASERKELNIIFFIESPILHQCQDTSLKKGSSAIPYQLLLARMKMLFLATWEEVHLTMGLHTSALQGRPEFTKNFCQSN